MTQTYQWFLGIDWGSEVHHLCLLNKDGTVCGEQQVKHEATAVQSALSWVFEHTQGASAADIAVAIETPRGAVIDAVLERGLAVFAINPRQLDRFRDRFTTAGAKDDRRDALVLADSLRTDPAAFQPVPIDDPVIMQLREWARVEADVDREQRALTNRLREQIYRLTPTLLELCPAADEAWLWTVLERAPTPAAQLTLSRARISAILREHRIRRIDASAVLERLRAPRFPLAAGVTEAAVAHIKMLIPRVQLLQTQRVECIQRTEALLETLRARPEAGEQPGEPRDIALLESLPGVGRKTTIALLTEASQPLAARAYHALRTQMGIAPVTQASGKRKTVRMRYACRHRLRQAAYHWGRVAAQRDASSKTYYRKLRARGHSHGRALRSVIDRLLRILTAMLRTRSLYDASRFETRQAT